MWQCDIVKVYISQILYVKIKIETTKLDYFYHNSNTNTLFQKKNVIYTFSLLNYGLVNL